MVADMGEALKRNPEFAIAYNNRGNAWVGVGEAEAAHGIDPRESYQKAIADFGESLKRTPGYAAAYNNRGRAWQRLAEAEAARGAAPSRSRVRAISDHDRALALNPSLWQAYASKGLLLEQMDRPDEAVGCYEAAARLVGASQPPLNKWLARARLAATNREWAGRVRSATQALQRCDYAAARTMYEEAISAAPETAASDAALRTSLSGAHHDLARIYALLSDGREGPTEVREAIAADEAARCRERAFQHLSRAIDLGWNDHAATEKDSDLAALHADPKWQEQLQRMKVR